MYYKTLAIVNFWCDYFNECLLEDILRFSLAENKSPALKIAAATAAAKFQT